MHVESGRVFSGVVGNAEYLERKQTAEFFLICAKMCAGVQVQDALCVCPLPYQRRDRQQGQKGRNP